MRRIEEFDEILEAEGKGKRIRLDAKEYAHINITMFRAYERSLKAQKQTLDFDDVIRETDVKEIANACREYGIVDFTISATDSRILQILSLFAKEGVELIGLTETKNTHPRKEIGEARIVPAYRMMVRK